MSTSLGHPEHDQLTHLRGSTRPKGKRQTKYLSKRSKLRQKVGESEVLLCEQNVGFQELGIRRKKKAVEQATHCDSERKSPYSLQEKL